MGVQEKFEEEGVVAAIAPCRATGEDIQSFEAISLPSLPGDNGFTLEDLAAKLSGFPPPYIKVLKELLKREGASGMAELAEATGLSLDRVRSALRSLAEQSLVELGKRGRFFVGSPVAGLTEEMVDAALNTSVHFVDPFLQDGAATFRTNARVVECLAVARKEMSIQEVMAQTGLTDGVVRSAFRLLAARRLQNPESHFVAVGGTPYWLQERRQGPQMLLRLATSSGGGEGNMEASEQRL